MTSSIGQVMHSWMRDLFPLNRSLTGDGVLKTLDYLSDINPNLKTLSTSTGTEAFDWVIPKEWQLVDAFVAEQDGTKVISIDNSNLHIVGYSTPVNALMSKDELLGHLHFLESAPDSIPYVTSYYKENWGFCLTYNQFLALGPGPFRVVIDTKLFPGNMHYGELIIPGKTKNEILLSTYICHPSMASNELSGPVVLSALAKWASESELNHTIRCLFLPETIGAIYYLSKHLQDLKQNVRAGWVLTCLGDNQNYSFVPTKWGNTITDSITKRAFEQLDIPYRDFGWLERGSDERQFCAPGVELPIASVMRSKYGEFPEYHTSADNLSFATPDGLEGSFNIYRRMIEILETSEFPRINVLCEPQLGKRGLYPEVSTLESFSIVKNQMNVISFLDGKHDIDQIADLCQISRGVVEQVIGHLAISGLIDWV
jgi:aminopeptidase-like protein